MQKPYARCLFSYSGGLLSALEQCCYFISNKCRDEEIEHLKNAAIKAAFLLRQNNQSISSKLSEHYYNLLYEAI